MGWWPPRHAALQFSPDNQRCEQTRNIAYPVSSSDDFDSTIPGATCIPSFPAKGHKKNIGGIPAGIAGVRVEYGLVH
jgi:hypothetical protein